MGVVLGDEIGPASARPYAYVPITAGGIAIAYNLTVDGTRYTDLRLSPETLAGIFMGAITRWSDARITADTGRTLPDVPVVPIVRSDAAGDSFRFTEYLEQEAPLWWSFFCLAHGLPATCGPTSYYPYGANIRAEAGADGVANAVAAPYNNGAITYVGYGYALQRDLPVAAVKNRAGAFVQPTSRNVSVALTGTAFSADGLPDYSHVYANPDARAYPLSMYSLVIAPTTTAAPFTVGKGVTLSRFLVYALCQGQEKASQLGYAPLPGSVVATALTRVRSIPGATPLQQCPALPTVVARFGERGRGEQRNHRRPDTAHAVATVREHRGRLLRHDRGERAGLCRFQRLRLPADEHGDLPTRHHDGNRARHDSR
jgi:phosphate transport system substrate-binding protein